MRYADLIIHDPTQDSLRLQNKLLIGRVRILFQIFSLSEDSETGPDGKKKGQKKAKKSNKSKANQRKNSKKSNTPQTGNDLSAKIFATMEKHKEVFFVIRLHSAQSAASLAVSARNYSVFTVSSIYEVLASLCIPAFITADSGS